MENNHVFDNYVLTKHGYVVRVYKDLSGSKEDPANRKKIWENNGAYWIEWTQRAVTEDREFAGGRTTTLECTFQDEIIEEGKSLDKVIAKGKELGIYKSRKARQAELDKLFQRPCSLR